MTDLSTNNILSGALDIEALLAVTDSIANSSITYLPNLHAKVYVADEHTAIITSANMTEGGLTRNFEYGAVVMDQEIVARIRKDIEQYASLGSIVPKDVLKSLAEMAGQAGERIAGR